jgi:hypothetical protein
MRQEPSNRHDVATSVVDQCPPPDDPVLAVLDHSHTGLPRRCSLHQAAALASGRRASRRVQITENSASEAKKWNTNRPPGWWYRSTPATTGTRHHAPRARGQCRSGAATNGPAGRAATHTRCRPPPGWPSPGRAAGGPSSTPTRCLLQPPASRGLESVELQRRVLHRGRHPHVPLQLAHDSRLCQNPPTGPGVTRRKCS